MGEVNGRDLIVALFLDRRPFEDAVLVGRIKRILRRQLDLRSEFVRVQQLGLRHRSPLTFIEWLDEEVNLRAALRRIDSVDLGSGLARERHGLGVRTDLERSFGLLWRSTCAVLKRA